MFKETSTIIEDFEIVQGASSEVTFLSAGYNEFLNDDWVCTLTITDVERTTLILNRNIPKTADLRYFKFFLTPLETISFKKGIYELSIEVNNNTLQYNREIVKCYMKVHENLVTLIPPAPVFDGNTIIDVPENQVTCTTLVATDALIYSISGGNSDAFNINEETGEVTFKAAPNFEVQSLYTFVATAQGLGGTTNETYIINITDIAIEPPTPVFITPNIVNTPENSFNAILIQATDTIMYSISSGDSADFNIDPMTGLVKFNTRPDYETKNVYSFIATASGPGGLTNELITINVTDINEFPPPYFTMWNVASVEEGGYEAIKLSGVNIVSYSISGGDSLALNVNSSTGEVMFKVPTDFETQNHYTFTATCTGLGGSADEEITIKILNKLGD